LMGLNSVIFVYYFWEKCFTGTYFRSFT
jgi:hypothetical protein